MDVDILELVEKFKKEVHKYREFYIPSNVVLALSILLRAKAQYLEFYEGDFFQEDEQIFLPQEDIDLELEPLRIRKGKLNIRQLIKYVDKEINKIKKTRKKTHKIEVFTERKEIKFEKPRIEEEMEKFFSKLKAISKNGRVLFSMLDGERVKNLFFLLWLESENKVKVFQEFLFGEIIIEVVADGESG